MDAALCLIFDQDQKQVLLVHRRDIPVWVIPGGGIDQNESPEAAAVREALEETGFEVEIIRKVGDYSKSSVFTHRTHLFHGRIIDGKPKIGSESLRVEFFPVDALPTRIPPPHRFWIADALKNQKAIIRGPVKGAGFTDFFKALFTHPTLIFRFILTKVGLRYNTK